MPVDYQLEPIKVLEHHIINNSQVSISQMQILGQAELEFQLAENHFKQLKQLGHEVISKD